MRVVNMRTNVPRIGCSLGQPEGHLAEMRCLGASNKIHAQILDRTDPKHHNRLKRLASRTRFELVLPP